MSQSRESEWEKGSLIDKTLFTVANPMLRMSELKKLDPEDLMLLPKKDEASTLLKVYSSNFNNSIAFGPIPKIFVAAYKSQKYVILVSGFTVFIESILRISCPIVLQLFLQELGSTDAGSTSRLVYLAVVSIIVLCCLPFNKNI